MDEQYKKKNLQIYCLKILNSRSGQISYALNY